MKSSTIVFLMFIHITLFSQINRKALIIGIDGVRGDAALVANTPKMDALADQGIVSYEAQTLANTVSGPGWTTILTGVWMDKHEVRDNTFIPNNMSEFPHFFQHVETLNPNLSTVSIVHWSPINILVTPLLTTDVVGTYNSDAEVRDACIDVLQNDDPDIIFLHFDDVDHAGHSSGFSSTNPEYLDAIELMDDHVANIMDALENRPDYNNEEWLIILCTDHGGLNTGHDCNQRDCQDIFQIISTPFIEPEVIEKNTISQQIDDAIVLNGNSSFLEIPEASQYNFDGKNFTIEIKLKTNGWQADAPIISNKNWGSGFNEGFILSGNMNGNSWKFNIGNGLINRMDIEGGNINDGEWHHIAVSFARDGFSFTWQDGYVQALDYLGFLFDVDSNLPIIVGQDGTTNYTSSFEGSIGEIRIWDTNLRNITLNEWHCKDINSEHPNYGNLVGHWKMDEGSGTLISDASSYSNSGTLMNGVSWLNDFSSYACFDFSPVPHNVDIVPTVLEFMCLEQNDIWGIDGRSWVEGINCNSTSDENIIQQNNIKIYPNITSGNVYYEFEQDMLCRLRCANSDGKQIINKKINSQSGYINLKGHSSGIYFLFIEDENQNIIYQDKIVLKN